MLAIANLTVCTKAQDVHILLKKTGTLREHRRTEPNTLHCTFKTYVTILPSQKPFRTFELVKIVPFFPISAILLQTTATHSQYPLSLSPSHPLSSTSFIINIIYHQHPLSPPYHHLSNQDHHLSASASYISTTLFFPQWKRYNNQVKKQNKQEQTPDHSNNPCTAAGHHHHPHPCHRGRTVRDLLALAVVLLFKHGLKGRGREVWGVRLVHGSCWVVAVTRLLRRLGLLVVRHAELNETTGESITGHGSEREDSGQYHVPTFVGELCVVWGGAGCPCLFLLFLCPPVFLYTAMPFYLSPDDAP